MFDLANKIALITGASRGLGWSMAQSLAKAGAHVVLNARDEKLLSERVKTLTEQGLSAQSAAFDVTDFEAAQACLCKAVTPLMVEKKNGRIILIGSMSAINARPSISAYVASKGAVHALCKQLAVELAPNLITVNCIAPGFFATEMNTALVEDPQFTKWVKERTPVGRWGRIEEIGPAAVFLASDEASFVNGLIMTVDGGFTSAM